MTREEFRDAVHKGLGRAILYAHSNDVSEFRDIILDACLHNLAIDPQCEGTHGGYALNLIEKLPDRDFYCAEVLKALPDDQESWHARHRYYLAMNFALLGSEAAKRAMYGGYAPGPRFGEGIGNTFVQLDGLGGFLFAVDKLGALLLAGCDNYDHGWLMCDTDELSEHARWDALRAAAVDNPRAAAYLAAPTDRGTISNDSYDQLRPKLSQREWAIQIGGWGRNATDADLNKAAHGLIAATEADDQAGHLRIFRSADFPLGPEPLLALLDSQDHRVVHCALTALEGVPHSKVRELAFRLIETHSSYRTEAIALLRANFEPGDHAIALRWFESETDPETIHGLSSDLRYLWEDHPDPTTETVMLHTSYERDYCSFNREFVVRRLLELDAVTDAMRAECPWDANDQIRDLFKS